MKFFLQDVKTAKFMRCDSTWTLDINEALNFLSVQRAVLFGMKELKNAFQIMQIESNEFSSSITVIIPPPPWSSFQAHPLQTTHTNK